MGKLRSSGSRVGSLDAIQVKGLSAEQVNALGAKVGQLSASAFTNCRLEAVRSHAEATSEPLLRQALLQQLVRCQDMAQLRTGSVLQRVTHLLGLMGLTRAVQESGRHGQADAARDLRHRHGRVLLQAGQDAAVGSIHRRCSYLEDCSTFPID